MNNQVMEWIHLFNDIDTFVDDMYTHFADSSSSKYIMTPLFSWTYVED